MNRSNHNYGCHIDIPFPTSESARIPSDISSLPDYFDSVESVEEVFKELADIRSLNRRKFLFRGHSDTSYKLVSSLGRRTDAPPFFDQEHFEEWKILCERYDCGRFRMPTFNEDLFYLSIGRHLSLDCRLLDWTTGFWEAFAFLLYDNPDSDGALWILSFPNEYKEENISPFSITDERVHYLREDYYFPDNNNSWPIPILRRARQHGVFTVVKESLISIPLENLPLESYDLQLKKIVVPKSLKELLRFAKDIPDIEHLYVKKMDSIILDIKEFNDTYKKHV